MPALNLVIDDAFIRANTSFGGAGTTNVGTPTIWNSPSTGGGWIDVKGNVWRIQSNILQGTASAGSYATAQLLRPTIENSVNQKVFARSSTIVNDNCVAVCLRYQPTYLALTGLTYLIKYNASTSVGAIQVFVADASGSATLIDSFSQNATVGRQYSVTATAFGTNPTTINYILTDETFGTVLCNRTVLDNTAGLQQSGQSGLVAHNRDNGAGTETFDLVRTWNANQTTIAVNNANVWTTPDNWVTSGSSYIDTNNPGAYLKMGFTGTSLYLTVDTSSNPSELPKIGYIVDGGAIQYYTITVVNSATTVPLIDNLSAGTHQVKIMLAGLGKDSRWTTPTDHLQITAFAVDSGSTTVAPTLKTKRILVYGDSITEGASALGTGNTVANKDWPTTWDARVATIMNAEISVVAFQAQGYTKTGQGGVPTFTNSYNLIRSGVNRTFSTYDYVFIWQGQNDDPGDITSANVVTMLTNIRAKCPSAYIFHGIPFSGNQRAIILAGVASFADPITFALDQGQQATDIVGNINWSYDGLHPNPGGAGQLAALVAGNTYSHVAGGGTGSATGFRLATNGQFVLIGSNTVTIL